MVKQQLINELNRLYEALEFAESLRDVVPREQQICSLKFQIRQVKAKLNKLRKNNILEGEK